MNCPNDWNQKAHIGLLNHFKNRNKKTQINLQLKVFNFGGIVMLRKSFQLTDLWCLFFAPK